MILAIDPGGATGIALLWPTGVFHTDTIEGGFIGMADWIYDGLWDCDTVVMENFVPRPGAKSQQLDALHIIGAVKYECRRRGIPVVMQTPTQAKSFATNDKLKAVGWYTVGADHERDAARHMLVYVASALSKAPGGAQWAYDSERTRILNVLAAL